MNDLHPYRTILRATLALPTSPRVTSTKMLGLTPASRSRLQITEEVDPMDAIEAAISQMPLHPDFIDKHPV